MPGLTQLNGIIFEICSKLDEPQTLQDPDKLLLVEHVRKLFFAHTFADFSCI